MNTEENYSTRSHIRQLVEWMANGVYEKEQIIAMALLCAVAGENIFLLGPPGTAKSLVASRLKDVFSEAKSFDYLMSRFSTPDEIFGPISISRLKNEDKYERLVDGYLPSADVVFLDEIWKAGPSIQNTLLTVINEHIYHNGSITIRTPMKVLIAASNELPAKDEGLEALWDRFLVRMVSNCIVDDNSFINMIRGEKSVVVSSKPKLIPEELYHHWQTEVAGVSLSDTVRYAILELRKRLSAKDQEDGNQLRYYVSDRRWKKAFRLMQTSAYLNGRVETDLSDFLLLIHCFWNDVECREESINMILDSIMDMLKKKLEAVDKALRQIGRSGASHTQNRPEPEMPYKEFNSFYYKLECYPEGEFYFSKVDYANLELNTAKEGLQYFDKARNAGLILVKTPGIPMGDKPLNGNKSKSIVIQKCNGGIMIDGTAYTFVSKDNGTALGALNDNASAGRLNQINLIQQQYDECQKLWENISATLWQDNIFLSSSDLQLLSLKLKVLEQQLKETEIKIQNKAMSL